MSSRWENCYEGLDPFAARLAKKMGRWTAGWFGLVDDDRCDVEQVLMIAAWRSLPRFDPKRGTKEGFLTRVMRNQFRKLIKEQQAGCRDYRRVAGSLQDFIHGDSDSGPVERGEAFDAGEYLRQTSGRIDSEEQTGLAIDLGCAIRPLAPELRAICGLLAEGFSDAEIARRLGISRPAFYRRMEKLQRRLELAGIDDYLQ